MVLVIVGVVFVYDVVLNYFVYGGKMIMVGMFYIGVVFIYEVVNFVVVG